MRLLDHPLYLLLFSVFPLHLLYAQEGPRSTGWDLALEEQVYPTGLVSGARITFRLAKHSAIHLRLGHNLIRHRDLGVQDDERGYGWGGSIGYGYYFSSGHRGWWLGLRSDIWRSQVRWISLKDQGAESVQGTTRILVLQPTVESGYLWVLGVKQRLILAGTISLGREINVITEGRSVGEGAILLLGIQFGIRL